jgi:ribonuclease HI
MATEEPAFPVQIYTDGGCKPNPGPGGWGAVVRLEQREWLLSGNDLETTNNQMEMQAAVVALATLDSLFGRCTVDLFTDSEYLRQGITNWIDAWERNGWQTKDGESVKNKALWQSLHGLRQQHTITWHWLRGHAGHIHNERADWLATRARKALRIPAPSSDTLAGVKLPDVHIFVKASYNAINKIGGWAVVLRKGDHVRTLNETERGISINALLVRAATQALNALTRPCSVIVYSDADYLIRGASQWITGWLARGWETRDGKPVANRHEWESLLDAMKQHQVSWQQGSTDEMADLAEAARLASEASSR